MVPLLPLAGAGLAAAQFIGGQKEKGDQKKFNEQQLAMQRLGLQMAEEMLREKSPVRRQSIQRLGEALARQPFFATSAQRGLQAGDISTVPTPQQFTGSEFLGPEPEFDKFDPEAQRRKAFPKATSFNPKRRQAARMQATAPPALGFGLKRAAKKVGSI